MPSDLPGLFLIALSFAVTFAAARFLGNRWRARRRERDVAASRAAESRQVRRARERRTK